MLNLLLLHKPAKFEVLSSTEITRDESYQFFDAKKEYGRRNCLAYQVLVQL